MPKETATFAGATAAPVNLAPIPADTGPRYSFSATGVWGGATLQVFIDNGVGEPQILDDVFISGHRPAWSWNYEGPGTPHIKALRASSATDLTLHSNRVD